MAEGKVGNVLGLRGPRPVPLMTEPMSPDEMHDEAMRYAMTASQQVRREAAEWREKAESVTAEYVAFKADAVQEALIAKHEYDTKSAMMRAKIDALDAQLQDMARKTSDEIKELKRKLDHYEHATAELSTKCDDMDKFYVHELRAIRDATNHMQIGLIAGINNVTTAVTDTVRHSAEGVLKQVENSANNMGAFIDDLRKRRAAGEYIPRQDRMKEPLPALAPDAEEALAKLVQQIKAKPTEATPAGEAGL